MIKKLLFTLSLCMLFGSMLYAQSTIKGDIKDQNGNPVIGIQVLLKQEDKVLNGAYTNDLGSYQIFGISAGTYDITAQGMFNCLTTHTEKGIRVSGSEVKFVNLQIDCSSNELKEVEVIYVPPVFEADNVISSTKLTGDEIRKTPGRSITSALATVTGGVATVDGEMKSARGLREAGQVVIIDGVRVRGSQAVPMDMVESAELMLGGIPAEFGDGSSFFVINTKGAPRDYHGGVGIQSSLEGYGQMLAEASVSGPIVRGKTPQDPSRMGFFFAAEGTYNIDGNPARGGTWVAKPETIKNLIDNPIEYRHTQNGYTPFYAANYLGSEHFKNVRVRQNADNWSFMANGKIDIMGGGKDARGRSKNNLRFTIGASYQYNQRKNWGQYYQLFDSKNNSIYTGNTLRLSARINHRVKTDTAANAILKNVMYDVNINYTLFNSKTQDKIHKDNYFGYGYIGQFKTERSNFYTPNKEPIYTRVGAIGDSAWVDAIQLIPEGGYQAKTWITFNKEEFKLNGNYYNPDLISYTQNFIDFIKEKTGVDINDADELDRRKVLDFVYQNFGWRSFTNETVNGAGLLFNGEEPPAIANGLYASPGTLMHGGRNSYTKSRTEAIGAKATLSLNLQDHEIRFGFELDKRTDRGYSLNAIGLWNRMKALTDNTTFFSPILENTYWLMGDSIPVFDQYGDCIDTLLYRINNQAPNFYNNFRESLGFGKPGNDALTNYFLDIDSYDPSIFKLDFFSPYELFNNGNTLVSYYGYDYTGKKSNKKLNINDFFGGGDLDAKDYAIGAYEPIYMAFFLQDKFSIQNLLFSVGLRVDYFNSNQYVLKDPFLFRPAYTVDQLRNSLEWEYFKFPDNVGSNWIPYVSSKDNDITGSRQVVAYRDGKIWYNIYGQEIKDPTSDLGDGGPILYEKPKEDAISKVSYDAFTKYKPQWNVMPRISFSFPVSTNSNFSAHYNIITYRPTNLLINPMQYLYIERYNTTAINNPNLRPIRTVEYEIGFNQKVGENAALKISAYYNEYRDEIQSYRYSGAYPYSYYSFENMDFGTTQGISIELQMRGAKNLTFGLGYTLAFAKGTGSTAESNLAILRSGQPNLRTLTNLNHDQRHNFSGMIDFRFSQGTNYNGPVTRKQQKNTETIKEIRWFENAGATLLFSAASGMPYSRASLAYSEWWSSGQRPPIKGSINGANMPWNFQFGLRIDKSFMFNLASKKDKTDNGQRKKKPGFLMVYLDFQNLLNLKNAVSVYEYTGRADDDGYLSSQLFQDIVKAGNTIYEMGSEDIARNYYSMRVADPYNYNLPFRVYLGIKFSF